MNHPSIIHRLRTRYVFLLLLAGIGCVMNACNKVIDQPLRTVSNGVRDSSADIRSVLAGSPYHLFSQAFQRLALDSGYGVYTVFAPTDSAMQAAGLTSAVIDTLSTDSLYKLIAWQAVYGTYSDSILASSPTSLQAPSLREDVYYVVQTSLYAPTSLTAQTAQENLYLWKSGILYVNGTPANQGETPLKARNGWIWPVDRLFAAPAATSTWNIITSRPELSLYAAAYRLVDSFYSQYPVYIVTPDSILFAAVNYENLPIQLTVFAPTNDAFAKAGFHTVDDLRNYMAQEIPGATSATINGVYYNYTNYSNLDSILKAHYVYNEGVHPLMYQDLLNPAAMNNGWWNSNEWTRQAFTQAPFITPYYSQFSGNNGSVNIQYNHDPSVPPAVLPPDVVRIMAVNGIIYETDQLFYPHN